MYECKSETQPRLGPNVGKIKPSSEEEAGLKSSPE